MSSEMYHLIDLAVMLKGSFFFFFLSDVLHLSRAFKDLRFAFSILHYLNILQHYECFRITIQISFNTP